MRFISLPVSDTLVCTMYQKNISLAPLSTLKVGGVASNYIVVENIQTLQKVIEENREKQLPIFVLGGGSNVLFSDAGWKGLVIHIKIGGIEWKEFSDDVECVAGAGIEWDSLVEESVRRGLYGLENLSLIPGTVGASPIQNIGAYGAEVSDTIKWVEAISVNTGEIRVFRNEECDFSYRNSFFKTGEGKEWIIVRASFLLKKNGKLNTTYADIIKYFRAHEVQDPSLSDVRKAVIAIRSGKLPDLSQYGTAGSFFKNPVISLDQYKKLQVKYPDIPGYKSDGGIKVSLAWILDHVLGLKGYLKGRVGLYECQPLVIVTRDGAKSRDVRELAAFVQARVKEGTQIDIEPEVRFIGE